MSEYEHTEHLLIQIDYLRTANRQLREYAEDAVAKIKRLEEAGDALYENSDPTRWDSLQAANRKLDQQEEWRKAKEAKP